MLLRNKIKIQNSFTTDDTPIDFTMTLGCTDERTILFVESLFNYHECSIIKIFILVFASFHMFVKWDQMINKSNTGYYRRQNQLYQTNNAYHPFDDPKPEK